MAALDPFQVGHTNRGLVAPPPQINCSPRSMASSCCHAAISLGDDRGPGARSRTLHLVRCRIIHIAVASRPPPPLVGQRSTPAHHEALGLPV